MLCSNEAQQQGVTLQASQQRGILNTCLCTDAVSAVLFERLGHRGAALAEPLLERVGELCAAAAEAAEAAEHDGDDEEEEGAVGVECAGAAAAAMSAALRHLGPENVLRALPLNLEEVRGVMVALSHGRVLLLLEKRSPASKRPY